MIGLDVVFLLFIIIIAVYTWYESLRIREMVIEHCKHLCREAGVQLLDQTVAQVSLSLKRTNVGSFALLRRYQFEVSEDGVDRYQGYVTLLGGRIIESRLEGPHGQNTFHQPKLH